MLTVCQSGLATNVLKQYMLQRNKRLQNFQGCGNPHLSQPATRSKKQHASNTTYTLNYPERLHNVAVPTTFKENFSFAPPPLSYSVASLNFFYGLTFCSVTTSRSPLRTCRV